LTSMTTDKCVVALEAGRRTESVNDCQGAASIYQQALSLSSAEPRALHRLGVMAYRTGRFHMAANLIQRAIDVDPDRWEYHKDMGNVHKRQGNLALSEASLLNAVSLSGGAAEAYYDLGILYQISEQPVKALASYRRAVHRNPDHAQAWNNMGLIYTKQGRRDKAVECFETAIAKHPDFAGAHNNLGDLYTEDNQLSLAARCYRKSLAVDPRQAGITSHLGLAYQLLRKPEKAVRCHQKAIGLQPETADHWINLGTAFQDLDNLQNAIICYQKAISIAPQVPQAYLNMGLVNKELGRHTEARRFMEKAVELDPDYENALNHLVTILVKLCAWEAAEKYGKILDQKTLVSLGKGIKPAENPFLNLIRHANPELNYKIARAWSQKIELSASNRFNHFTSRNPPKDGRLNIGYLSGNVGNHPTSDLTMGLFECHDRERFKIFCYSYGKADDSHQRIAIRNFSDEFRDIRWMDDVSAAKVIRNDKVDILVDLMGHTKGARLGICAHRPSPIQARMLGMAGTTGASFFDYLIGDRIVTPTSEQVHYSEALVHMPHSYQINNYANEKSDEQAIEEAAFCDETRFVFACFCTAYKIEQNVFQAWMQILRRVPESVLWLMPESAVVKQNLRAAASQLGMDCQRLVFLEKLEKKVHFKRLSLVDVALDTHHVNGAATTSDALWVGVPVITLKGSHFASRMSASLLNSIGMHELVAKNQNEYIEFAVKLATHPTLLNEIKLRMGKSRRTCPLFDRRRYVSDLEKVYQCMARRLVEGRRCEPITINDPELGLR
jgi:protein O-GlcNAc transferase